MFLLASCGKIQKQFSSFTPDRKTAYLDHDVAEPMQVPANLSTDPQVMRDLYPIPSGQLPAENAEPVEIVPPPVIRYETQQAALEAQETDNG
jgi:uncharacterized lipoprotein